MTNHDLVIIGGGPAGLAAAIEARKKGIQDILVLERDRELGGILQQCIHNGFGLHIFKEELTGPEYAERFINELKALGIDYKLDTMVLSLTKDKDIAYINPADGYVEFKAKAIILAMGCRERTRGAVAIPGSRPAGVMTAGTAQRYINIEGSMVGKEVVILGSGDIGLIMARRMSLEGANVKAVAELMPFSGGLTRNIVQCLDDYDIPLLLSHTVTNIKGKNRLEGVTIAKVDENLKPIPGSEQDIACDTLLLSVGLIPENELSVSAEIAIDKRTRGPHVSESMETSIKGIFACGNVVHVHDLVDFVTEESRRAGACAADYLVSTSNDNQTCITTEPLEGVSYIVPQRIHPQSLKSDLTLFFRVKRIFHSAKIEIYSGNQMIHSIKKKHMAPGEMENIKLPLNLIPSDTSDQIKVAVKEVI